MTCHTFNNNIGEQFVNSRTNPPFSFRGRQMCGTLALVNGHTRPPTTVYLENPRSTAPTQ